MTDDFKLKEIIQYLDFYEVMKEFLEVYSIENVGYNCTINHEAVAKYMNSNRFLVRFKIGNLDKEAIFNQIEDDIINWHRIWDLLNLTNWQIKIMERQFEVECEEKEKDLKIKYKCPTCKYLNVHNTSFGAIHYCKAKINTNVVNGSRGISLDAYKTKCKYYMEAD